MGLMDFFKKTGMLKSGGSSYKGNASERPQDMNDDPNPISGNETQPDADSGSNDSVDE